MAKIFISYSSADESYANQLSQALSSSNQEVLGATARATWKTTTTSEIRNAITSANAVVVLLSEASLKSTWVLQEIGVAWGWRKALFTIIVPDFVFDPDAMPPILQDVPVFDARRRTPTETAEYIVQSIKRT